MTPEVKARQLIDEKLGQSGWVVQDIKRIDLGAGTGVAVREYPTDTGPADYVLFVNRNAVGVIEAKKDTAAENITAVETQTERYATARLKWRKNNAPLRFLFEATGQIVRFTDNADPAPRSRWEAKQLAKFQEQGKTPPKEWQKKYPEPAEPDTADLSELPPEWVWATMDQLSEFITSGSRGWADYYSDIGATFIRSQNINKDRLDLTDIAFVDPPRAAEGARTRVRMNDLLLTITGANVGKAARVDVDIEEAYVSQHVSLIRIVEPALSDYLHLFLISSAGGRGQLDKEAYGAGKPGLNLQQVAAVSVPLPGLPEIRALIEAISMIAKASSDQESAITSSIRQSTAQRQNILRAAFAGQLVPQDPNDEPASVLLARIRAEREATGGNRKRSRQQASA